MTYGQAIEQAKEGKKLQRMGWPRGHFIVYQKGYPDGIPCNKQTAEAYGYEEGDIFFCAPYLQKAENKMHYMYFASNEDALADDWIIF